jgi:hypothetical protein
VSRWRSVDPASFDVKFESVGLGRYLYRREQRISEKLRNSLMVQRRGRNQGRQKSGAPPKDATNLERAFTCSWPKLHNFVPLLPRPVNFPLQLQKCLSTHPRILSPFSGSMAVAGMSYGACTHKSPPKPPPTAPAISKWATRKSSAP